MLANYRADSNNLMRPHQTSNAPRTIEPAIVAANVRERVVGAALLKRSLPVPVAETDTAEPTVADGTGTFPPFSAVAIEEREAKPTEGGLKRNTE